MGLKVLTIETPDYVRTPESIVSDLSLRSDDNQTCMDICLALEINLRPLTSSQEVESGAHHSLFA